MIARKIKKILYWSTDISGITSRETSSKLNPKCFYMQIINITFALNCETISLQRRAEEGDTSLLSRHPFMEQQQPDEAIQRDHSR